MFENISVQISTSDVYSITVGNDILNELSAFTSQNYSTEKAVIIIDQQVHAYHYSNIEVALNSSYKKLLTYVVASGEQSKNLNQFSRIIDFVLNEGVDRQTPIIAIGGGVVGDLAGFVAASVLRGLPLIHVPTTLLAMVDSSVGGKTGVNHSVGKNLVGAFYQPKAVFTDVSFLKTLPREEWVNGLSEIIKYGMIQDPDLLNELKQLIEKDNFQRPELWIPIIKKSARIKVEIVQRDVKESGVRAYLNFGHTFAHVIERLGNYATYSHGEAVFAGMYGAVVASNKQSANISIDTLDSFKEYYSIDLTILKDKIDQFIPLMLRDKKVKDSTIQLVLLHDLGNPYVSSTKDHEMVNNSWEAVLNTFSD